MRWYGIGVIQIDRIRAPSNRVIVHLEQLQTNKIAKSSEDVDGKKKAEQAGCLGSQEDKTFTIHLSLKVTPTPTPTPYTCSRYEDWMGFATGPDDGMTNCFSFALLSMVATVAELRLRVS